MVHQHVANNKLGVVLTTYVLDTSRAKITASLFKNEHDTSSYVKALVA